MAFPLPRSRSRHGFQRTLTNTQRTVASLLFEILVAVGHFIDGMRVRAFEVPLAARNRDFRWNGYHQMDMVDLDVTFQYLDLSPFTQLPNDISNCFTNFTTQYPESILRAPNDMVFALPYGM